MPTSWRKEIQQLPTNTPQHFGEPKRAKRHTFPAFVCAAKLNRNSIVNFA
jgi:hypothetical protein